MSLRSRAVRPFLGFSCLINVVRSTDHSSQPLKSRDDTRTKNRDLLLTVYVYPTPDPPTPADRHLSACRRLISRAFPPHDVISLIGAVFESKAELQLISGLRGDDTQTFIDVIHQVGLHALSLPGCGLITFAIGYFAFELSPSAEQALDLRDLPLRLRRKCLSTLCKICGRRGLLPRSLQIPLCYDRSDTPLYRGGYADVWKGEYQGRHVAVKVLRVYSTSDFDKITNVGTVEYHVLTS